MKKILFVCTGNICRSPMAEYLLKRMLEEKGLEDYSVASAGVRAFEGHPATDKVVILLSKEGIQSNEHRSRLLTRDLATEADLILVMTSCQKEIVSGFCDKKKIYTLWEFALKNQGKEKKKRLQNLKKILAEGRETKEELEESLKLEKEIFQRDIQDPYGGSLETYSKSLEEIRSCLEKMIERFKKGEIF